MSDKPAGGPASSPSWPGSDANVSPVTGAFAKAEKTFGKLKERFESGRLSEPDLKERLRDLMVQDETGQWWVLGYETGEWYVRDGDEWVQREPPRAAARPAAPEDASGARSLLDTVWWPAVLIATGLGFIPALRPLTFVFDLGYENWKFLVGAVAGLYTATVLKSMYGSFQWKHVFVTAACWAAAFVLVNLSLGY